MSHLAHLRALEAAGLIRLAATGPDLEYTFRHVLLQEAVYHTLSKFARVDAHRAVAEAIQAVHGEAGSHLGDLAFHFAQAGQWERVLHYAARAGADAQAQYAPREALVNFDQAIEAARRLGQPAPWGVLRARGQAHDTLGQQALARADFEQALAQARAAGDRQAEWQSLLDFGFFWSANDYGQAGDCFRAALDLARLMGVPACLGHSLNRLGNWHMNNEEPEIARRYHEEALAIFDRLGDRHSQAQTLDLLGITTALSGDAAASAAYYPRAIALFREVGDQAGLISAQSVFLLRSLTYETEQAPTVDLSLAELEAEGQPALARARAIGLRSAETFLLGVLGRAYGPRGRYRAAFAASQAALEIAEMIEHRQWSAAAHFGMGALYQDVLAWPQARHHLEAGLALAQQTNSLIWIRHIGGVLLAVYAAQRRAGSGEADDAARAQAIIDLARTGPAPLTTAAALFGNGLMQWDLANGQAGRALERADGLRAFGARLNPNPVVVPALWLARAEALEALGRADEARADLSAARDRARQQGAQAMLWRSLLRLGRLGDAGAKAEGQAIIARLAEELPADLRENFLAQTLVY